MKLLGLWITDGSLVWAHGQVRGFQVHQDPNGPATKALRQLAKPHQLIEKGYSMWRSRKSKGKAATQKFVTELTFARYSSELGQTLLSWCGRYSRKRRLPAFVFELPENLRRALMSGLLLGDSGRVHGRLVYRTACRGLAGDVQGLALSLGYSATIHWAGGCWGVLLSKRMLDRAKPSSVRANVSKRKRSTRVVCFSVPNETLVTRSRGKPAFHGNTMQMHHVIDAELPMGLGFCGTKYLDVRYWKDDVKGDEGWLGLDDITMRSYNLRDCLVTLRLVPGFMQRVKQLGLLGLYEEEMQVAGIMGRATVRGLPIDFQRRDEPNLVVPVKGKKGITYERGLGPVLHDQMNDALARLRVFAGSPTFDPLKPGDVRSLVFGRLALPVVKLSKSGLHPSTDKEAMVLLALAADTAEQRAGIKAFADFKSAHKTLATFVHGLPALSDGRLHVSWKLLAATGRLMSSPNAQNWSKRVKKIFGYDSRYTWPWKLVGVDLKQAEMRGIAYLSKSKRLLEMYRRDLNVHTINAMLNLRARPQPGNKDLDPATEAFVISEALAMGIPDPSTYQVMPDGPWAATRTLIKKDGFGRNYGADDDTVFRILRSDRDPESNDLLFGALQRSDVQANGIVWAKVNHEIVRWWDSVQAEVKLKGFHQCPVSGRIRWFREGFKRTHILGHPNQTLIASIVNKRMIEIQKIYDQETGGQALIVQQVHDAVNSEVPNGYETRAGQVMVDAFEQRVALPGFPDAYFPADKPTVGEHLNEI